MTSYERRNRNRQRSRSRRVPVAKQGSALGSLPALLGAATLSMVMLMASALAAPGLGVIDEPLWQLQQARVFWRTVASVLLNVGGVAIAATLLGLLWTRALHQPPRSLVISAAGALVAVALTTLLCALLKDGWLPRVWPLYLLVTLGSALFGIGIALVMERSESPPLAFVLMSLLTGLVSIAGLATLIGLLLEPAPLPIDGVELDSADRVRLTQKIRAGSPRDMEPGSTKTLSFTSTDINQLSAWGLSLGDAGRMAFVNLREQDIDAALSLRWAPGILSAPVYLNISATATPNISEGELTPGISAARIGRLAIPAGLANFLASGLFDLVATDPRFAGAVRQLHRVGIEARTLSATYGAMELPKGLREDVFGSLGDDEVVAVAFSQHLHLQRGLAATLETGELARDKTLATIVSQSFDLAARRHREYGSDPILENRLATIALGITLGHPKIGEVVAQLPPEFGTMQRLWSQAPLQDRSDWTRHFWVSAALACLSDQVVSLDIGQLKEELDAGSQGGSGFSFGDLAADLAGIELATALTSDKTRASQLQGRLAEADQFNQFVPTLKDLPEGLTDQELQQQFGGTEGEAYGQLVNEIAASIRAQPGYRTGP